MSEYLFRFPNGVVELPEHRHATFEEMLNCNECWLEEAAARKAQAEEALDGALSPVPGTPDGEPAER